MGFPLLAAEPTPAFANDNSVSLVHLSALDRQLVAEALFFLPERTIAMNIESLGHFGELETDWGNFEKLANSERYDLVVELLTAPADGMHLTHAAINACRAAIFAATEVGDLSAAEHQEHYFALFERLAFVD